jgi:hypothetical protein
MDYHADRFTDCSRMIFEDDRLVALFPASVKEDVVTSHGGLTYGGVLIGNQMTCRKMLAIFDGLKADYARFATTLRYKPIPPIYAEVPSQEDLYALFIHQARLIQRHVSSAIHLPCRLPFAKGRKHNLAKARKAGISVRETDDYAAFWEIEKEALSAHQARPVHSLEEIRALAAAFPAHIALYAAYEREAMTAGVVVYQHRLCAHAQYMGASGRGRETGALDAVIAYLIETAYKDFRYFDFGVSTERGGAYLNEGLIAQKEMFGARAVTYDHYEIDLL